MSGTRSTSLPWPRNRAVRSSSSWLLRHGIHPHTGANHAHTRRPGREDGPRTVGPDHLVVAQVDQEEVRFVGRAFASDLQGHVGVGRRYRRIDDLELPARILLAEHDGEDPAEVEGWIGKALRSRPAQDKDANGSGGLGGERAGVRARGKRPGEESPCETVIDRVAATGIRAEEECGWVAVSPQPQAGLQEAQAENRRKDHQRQPQEPCPPAAEAPPLAVRPTA